MHREDLDDTIDEILEAAKKGDEEAKKLDELLQEIEDDKKGKGEK